MRIKSSLLYTVLLVTGLTVAFSACKKDKVTPQSQVMVVQASPDAPGVDLLVDNIKVSSSLTFPNNSGYVTMNAGKRGIKINAAGSTTSLYTADLTISGNSHYSVFAIDRVSNISAIAVEDNLTPPPAGKAQIRFFQLCPSAPSLTIGTLVSGTFTSIYANRSFETQSSATAYAAFTAIDAGTYTFDARVYGTSGSLASATGITLTAGKSYTIFTRGIIGSSATPFGFTIITNN